MKIKNIEIQNYKAFREVERFEIDGKNVLIYGNNGSGKTSLASALQAFIQSSSKTSDQLRAVFDRMNEENVINLFAPADESSFVKITTSDNTCFEYSITGSTPGNVVLRGANQTCDFINYRLLFRFFNFHDNQEADVYPIFRDEFFPYWTDAARNQSYSGWYQSLCDELKRLEGKKTRRNAREFKALEEHIIEFNDTVQRQIINLTGRSNDFLRVYLTPLEPIQIAFRFPRVMRINPEQKWIIEEPIVRLAISCDGIPVNRPHVFLNEARLTALALALRFAAFEERPQRVSDFKILVLDDLLISLDMSLRMKVFNAIRDSYKQYQLFILTHDKGFYNYLRQALELDDMDWMCYEFYENFQGGHYLSPTVLGGKDCLERAEAYLTSKEYEICAIYLRKKAEELIRIYFDPTLESLSRYDIFEKLANALGGVTKEYNTKLLSQFMHLLESDGFTLQMVNQLQAERFRGDGLTLSPAEIGKTNTLRSSLLGFLERYYRDRLMYQQKRQELVVIADKVSKLRSVILNVGAHQGNIPLYETELQEAIEKLKDFEKKIKDKTLYT
jgi:energy-coupling factor transporter ATP-binding protein EcfA2